MNELRKQLKSFAKRLDNYQLMQLLLELNSDSELTARPEWQNLYEFLCAYATSNQERRQVQRLRRAAPFVARFSFRVADMRQGELQRGRETAPVQTPAA